MATIGNKNKLNCLMEMARDEAALVPSLTEMAMVEASQRTSMGKVTTQTGAEIEGLEEETMEKVKNKLNEREEAFNEKLLNLERNYGDRDDITVEETGA